MSGTPSSPRVLAVLGRGPVPWGTPVVCADDAGLTRGDGCFEGIRVSAGRVTKLERHLARMARSAAALELPFDAPAWTELVNSAVAAWPADVDGALKLVLTRGADATATGLLTLVVADPGYPAQRRDGIAVVTLSRGVGADVFTAAPWLLGGVKTLSYAVNMAAQREAARRGADDVVFVSTDGSVLEAPTASVVWAPPGTSRTLRTVPAGATGILPGTTQQLMFDVAQAEGWDVGEAAVSLEGLRAAGGIWLVSSVRGPVEVVRLDGAERDRVPEASAGGAAAGRVLSPGVPPFAGRATALPSASSRTYRWGTRGGRWSKVV